MSCLLTFLDSLLASLGSTNPFAVLVVASAWKYCKKLITLPKNNHQMPKQKYDKIHCLNLSVLINCCHSQNTSDFIARPCAVNDIYGKYSATQRFKKSCCSLSLYFCRCIFISDKFLLRNGDVLLVTPGTLCIQNF